MSGITRTTLIECPRSQSDEGLANNKENPSQWTNRAGDGINLKPGDKISVHSSYVSEIGAEAGQIQIKGQDLNASVEIETTDTIESLFEDELPSKYVLSTVANTKKTIEVRDDTLNLVVSPYKCANGEYYAHLPRRWIGDGTSLFWNTYASRDNATISGDIGQTQNAPYELNRCKADLNTKYWPYRGGVAHGRHRIDGRNDGSRYTIFRRKQTFFDTPHAVKPLVTGQAKVGSQIITLAHGSTTADILPEMEIIAQSPQTAFAGSPLVLEVISDTEIRVTAPGAILTTSTHNQFTFQFPLAISDVFLPPTTAGSHSAAACESFRDPALIGDYVQVRDLLTMKANPGYNSPSDLSDQLTQELNERKDFEKYEYPTQDAAGLVHRREPFTFKTETDAYKIYNCATQSNYSKTNHTEFIKTAGTWNVPNAYKYLSSYQNIGIKRPELYTSGILVNGPNKNPSDPNDYFGGYTGGKNGLVAAEFTPMSKGEEVFVTSTPWNKENILRFKAFFDAQQNYPELFDYTQSGYKCNVDETRYVHVNLFDNFNGQANIPGFGLKKWFFGANIRNASAGSSGLGYDLYDSRVSASQTSFPMFIDYNPDRVEQTETDVGYTDRGRAYFKTDLEADYNDLAFGFARRIRILNSLNEPEYVIGFQFTRTGNKIPDHFFHTNASASPGDPTEVMGVGNRMFGYDFHFTAYGTAAMILFNGNCTDQGNSFGSILASTLWTSDYFFGQATAGKEYKLEQYQFGMYLGAEEPQIKYNEDQGRFQLSDLHTSEKVGNTFDASYIRQTTIPNAPNNPSADDPCYKINKRMLKWNYSPEMTPYTDEFTASATGGSDNAYISHNVGIDPWSIMDAQSGLFIEDWIVPENLWDESLVGIMGFRYNQFHNPNSQSSRQVRLKATGANADLNNVNIITTNAIVSEGDIGAYQQNTVAAKMISPVLPISLQPVVAGSPAFKGRYITPAITVSPVESVNITAERLPTKTLRPYYTIRSDIVSEPNQIIGGLTSGITMPIVAITNKANPYGDFLNGFSSQEVFTNTIEKTITRIRCSIHEPDGSAARCDLNSAVIFKIEQQVSANLDIVGDLMQSKKKSDQLIAEEVEDPELEFQNVKYQAKDLFE